MKWSRKHLTTLAVSLLLIGMLIVAFALMRGGPRSILAGFDRNMQGEYEQFEFGTSQEDILAVLGPPMREEREFCLPPGHKGFNESLAAAQESTAVVFCLWRNGINWYYCLGFDESRQLVVKAEGNG
jgi:hypothetical protein